MEPGDCTKPESIAANAARLRNTVKEIEVVDPYTLVIHTQKTDLSLAQDLSMAAGYEGIILPNKYYDQVGADGFASKAVGSGPYKWVKGLVGSSIELEAVDKHWAEGAPKYKKLTYKVVPEENTRVAWCKPVRLRSSPPAASGCPTCRRAGSIFS